MTANTPEGTVTPEAMAVVNARVCHYRCGSCDYDETATWAEHEAHRRTHL